MPDLTRFDFHAKKFVHSEAVQEMDASEVGQYILLLCEAWLVGKDASLPDSPKYLARTARVEQLSPAVLACFPVVETEWGQRRRNETLYNEWLGAVNRSDNGRAKANARWGNTTEEPGECRGNAPALLLHRPGNAQPNPTQAVSTQANPDHTNPDVREGAGSCNQEPRNLGSDWKMLALRHKRYFGQKASVMFKTKYAEACSKYTETVVLECFDAWAPSAVEWVKRDNVTNPLHAFFKKLPDEAQDALEVSQAEADADAEEKEKAVEADRTRQRQQAAQQASIDRQTTEITQRMHARPTQNEESVLDFLSEGNDEPRTESADSVGANLQPVS